MMRAPKSYAVAIRRRDDSITVMDDAMPDIRKGFYAWPMVRGVVTLVESLRLGSRSLNFSARYYEADMEAAENNDAENNKDGDGKDGDGKDGDGKDGDGKDGRAGSAPPAAGSASAVLGSMKCAVLSAFESICGAIVGLATSSMDAAPTPEASKSGRTVTTVALMFVVLLFVALPQLAAWGSSRLLGVELDLRTPGFQVLTGAFKLILVLGYMAAMRRIAEIRRVFMFHGAEHKAIAAYEAGEELCVANAKVKSRFHPRCGTTFLVGVVFVSILVFSGIGHLLPKFQVASGVEHVLFFLMKLPFLPVIAAITYEIQRLTARFCLTGPMRVILYPGFAVQSITTIEPTDAQIEIALASLQTTLWREQAVSDGPCPSKIRHCPSFSDLMALPVGAADQDDPVRTDAPA
ncbi:MAG: DUF1385 domain-containing protein [Polyangiaceae bacterium]|nr:DUF1385 domain-containing protein [Polyangiaceae bacterium]